jgi:hypothetical protein
MALELGAGPATRAQPSYFLPLFTKCLEREFSEVRQAFIADSSPLASVVAS